MLLQQYLQSAFPDGLPYEEAVQLCQRLFCTVDGVPAELRPECTKEGLAAAFTTLSRVGWVLQKAGSDEPAVHSPQHWIEIIKRVLAVGDLDMSLGERARERMLQAHAGGGHVRTSGKSTERMPGE